MKRSLSSAEQHAIERNAMRMDKTCTSSRISAETRIAKQLQETDQAITWSEALRAAKDMIDRLPQGADFAQITLVDDAEPGSSLQP